MLLFRNSGQPIQGCFDRQDSILAGSRCLLLISLALLALSVSVTASVPATATATSPPPQSQSAPGQEIGSMYIRQYRVDGGSNLLSKIQIEEAVYPFLGPGRTENDVEQARAALEKAFRDKGYQTVAVQIPQQQVSRGVVVLQVVEVKVGQLRVKGSHYFLPSEIKKEATSMSEGTVPDFNEVTKDIVALNQNADRKVTPVLRAGIVPGTVDIDLNVKDSLPLHGSLELNNRFNHDTKPLRLSGALSYDNLWQAGQKIGATFQIAPQRLSDSESFSGYYILPVPKVSWLSLMAQGSQQNSSVAISNGMASVGDGTVIGLRALITLPQGKDYYHSLSFGVDYKHFLPANQFSGSITYFPWSANYSMTVSGSGGVTDLNLGLIFNVRGMGASPSQFNDRRSLGTGVSANTNDSGDGSFIYLKGDLSHTHDLPVGFQLYGKIQGQVSDQQLVDTEQFSAGGFSNARGYLESSETGDDALFGTFELRSPSVAHFLGKTINEWRFYAFSDNGKLWLYNTGQGVGTYTYNLASVGVGSRIQFLDHLNGEVVLGLPLISKNMTDTNNKSIVPAQLLTFRIWGEF